MSQRGRIIIVHRNGGFAFAVAGASFWFEHESANLDALAQANGLIRHGSFDWAAGDAGARCALMEWPGADRLAAFPALRPVEGQLEWEDFPRAARKLAAGEDRRYLQLAVQYLAAGGVEDSVVAADLTLPMVQSIGDELRRRAGDSKETSAEEESRNE